MKNDIRNLYSAAMFLIVVALIVYAVSAHTQQPDPSPRIVMLGWEYIGNLPDIKKAGMPTRSSVFVDRVTHREILCLGKVDSDGLTCFFTGRER